MDFKSRMQSVLKDEELLEELREGDFLGSAGDETESISAGDPPVDVGDLRAATDRIRQGSFDIDDMVPAEAIIVRFGHPSLLVQGGTFKQPKLKTWQKRLNPHRAQIDAAIAGVGRIELKGNRSQPWVGTGWMIDETTVVTNRHVAQVFANRRGRSVQITPGMRPFIDYREEHGSTDAIETEIAEIVHLESARSGVDLAFLRLKTPPPPLAKVAPIPIAETLEEAETVGVIGYPAFDPRNSPADMHRIFEDIYDKKRFAPGHVMDDDRSELIFSHDCTTLGGNSGSVVIDVVTGGVVGLHFGGKEGVENRAVRPEVIRDRAAKMRIQVQVPAGGTGPRASDAAGDAGTEAPRHDIAHYQGREGYDPQFLGDGKFTMPLPKLNALQERDAAKLEDGSVELKYQHFSVVMNAARRLAFFTAVNIDGSDLWHKRRGSDRWGTDPRIAEEAQVDNALYKRNDFDRGHLVRRLDPVWGPKTEAKRAEEDTFHYTNAAPQHKDLNRRTWVDLENHVLARSEEVNAQISVFTGPIFGYADPRSRRTGLEEVGIPLGFWKLIGSRGMDRRRRRLDAQAFVIWQYDMIDAGDMEVVFGSGFETYQVPVIALERLTGLDFGPLREADTMGEVEETADDGAESPIGGFARNAYPIRDFDDIV